MSAMREWENIRDSACSADILRYTADVAALDRLLFALQGLHDTMAMHNDLKSRCWIPLISASLPQLAALRQQLPPVAAVYRVQLPPVDMRDNQKPVISVNTTQFLLHHEASTQVMTELKSVLLGMHAQLDNWHAQEFGNFALIEDHPHGPRDHSATWRYIERMVWENYTTAYAALMSGAPEPAQPAQPPPALPPLTEFAALLRRMRGFHV